MAYSQHVTCSSCKTDFGELIDFDRFYEIRVCTICRKLINAKRRPYRFDFEACSDCQSEIEFVFPRRRDFLKCPVCHSSSLRFEETAHVLMVHEEDYRRPVVGDLVHCRFTEGALASALIPDMPAIPLEFVTGLPDDTFELIAELAVSETPINPKLDRDYKLTFVAIVHPKCEQ